MQKFEFCPQWLSINLKVPSLKVLTIRTVIHSRDDRMNESIPLSLNILLQGSQGSMSLTVMSFWKIYWPKWNSQMPVDHVACLRLYASYKEPLNLFQNAPVFQLQYGKSVALPFVRAPSVEITDQWLLITAHDDDRKMVHKAKIYSQLRFTIHTVIRK